MQHPKPRVMILLAGVIALAAVAGTASARGQKPIETQLPPGLLSAKTVWVPIHVAGRQTTWSDTYQLFIDGQRVRTPAGESVGGFIQASDGGYVAMVRMDAGSEAYPELQLTPRLVPKRFDYSVMWAFFKLDATGQAPQILGIAACAPENGIPGTVRTEVTKDAIYCHEAYTTNDEDVLVGFSASGQVLHGPTGYAQIFAAKDHFVGAVRTVVNQTAICPYTQSRLDYWKLANTDGRWTQSSKLVSLDQSRNRWARIEPVTNSSIYVDMPSYSPAWLTDLVTYRSEGVRCSSNYNVGAPDTVAVVGLLDPIVQWAGTDKSVMPKNQIGIVGGKEDPENRSGSAPDPLGVGLAAGEPYGFYVDRPTGGLSLLSAAVGNGNNSIGLEFIMRGFKKDEGRMIFRPFGVAGLSFISVQTKNDLYIVPLSAQGITGKPEAAGLIYTTSGEQWFDASGLQAWLSQYSIRPQQRR